jgi:hypothetical protein
MLTRQRSQTHILAFRERWTLCVVRSRVYQAKCVSRGDESPQTDRAEDALSLSAGLRRHDVDVTATIDEGSLHAPGEDQLTCGIAPRVCVAPAHRRRYTH